MLFTRAIAAILAIILLTGCNKPGKSNAAAPTTAASPPIPTAPGNPVMPPTGTEAPTPAANSQAVPTSQSLRDAAGSIKEASKATTRSVTTAFKNILHNAAKP